MYPLCPPKLNVYNGELYVVAQTTELVDNRICYGKTAIFTGKNHHISVRHGTAGVLGNLRKQLEASLARFGKGVDYVLHAILRRLVDQYLPIFERRLFLALPVGLIKSNSIVPAPVATSAFALHDAAKRNDAAKISELLATGTTPIDQRDNEGRTALMVATHANANDAARVLILAGANVNEKDHIHDSPYLYAGARSHLEILRLTVSHGEHLKGTNSYGETALIPAAERGHVETVKTLIDAGVAVDHVNNLGWTALLEVVILGTGRQDHQKIVGLLIDAGANINLADRDGVTALRHASTAGYAEMEKRLVVAGCSIRARCNQAGFTFSTIRSSRMHK